MKRKITLNLTSISIMNLWARILRQLTVLAVALFFFSCEDETSLLGFKNPNKKFHVGYVDIPLNVSRVFTVDTLITDLRPAVENGQTVTKDGILVGEFQDPDLGKISAQSFLTIYPLPEANTALQSSAVYDSITVQFRLNFYAYGFSGIQRKTFSIHELTGDTLTLFGGKRYYANSIAPQYDPTALGEASITVNYDSLEKKAALTTSPDTLLASGRLNDEFGTRVFNAIKAGFATNADHKQFKSTIKGLALLPGQDPGILGFNVINNFGQLSRVILHYHTLTEGGAVDDTLSRSFGVDFASFTKIEADRTTTELAAMNPYESIEPLSDNRYVQSGAPLVTKLDLAPFYTFADSVDNILINSAELVINNVSSPVGLKPHKRLMFRMMNNNSDQFLNNRIQADREIASDYLVSSSLSEYYFFPALEDGSPVIATYDDAAGKYSGFMTIFAQSLFSNKKDENGINANRLKYLSVIPLDPSFGRGVTRTLFDKNNVSLRIYYTRANPVTP